MERWAHQLKDHYIWEEIIAQEREILPSDRAAGLIKKRDSTLNMYVMYLTRLF